MDADPNAGSGQQSDCRTRWVEPDGKQDQMERSVSVARATDGETVKTFFRTDRYFVVSNQWFFSTREAGDRGPFDTHDQAEQALQSFLRDEVGIRLSGWDQPGSDL